MKRLGEDPRFAEVQKIYSVDKNLLRISPLKSLLNFTYILTTTILVLLNKKNENNFLKMKMEDNLYIQKKKTCINLKH